MRLREINKAEIIQQLVNAAWGTSLPSDRALLAVGLGSLHTMGP